MARSAVVDVNHPSHVSLARREARAMAEAVGFGARESEEVALVVSELAGNTVKHATSGALTLTPISRDGRAGIRIECVDRGPGIVDVEKALADGFSTAGSLGYGLGTVNRLMDEMEVESDPGGGGGTHVVCTRWVRTSADQRGRCPLEFGVASRPHPKMKVNGDTFVVKRWREGAIAAVIDGLGHGEPAGCAAQAARHYVETHFDLPVADLFRGVDRACRATRGVVMAIARFDFGFRTPDSGSGGNPQSTIRNPQSTVRFSFGSVGNISVRAFRNTQRLNFMVRRGILGKAAPNPVVTDHPWEAETILVLHSDGLLTHWDLTDFPEIENESASIVAERLMTKLTRDDDDATVVVVRGATR